MSYPIIILGAGASYDYIDEEDQSKFIIIDHRLRPPLARELFSPKFEWAMKQFPELEALASEIDAAVNPPEKKDLETKLDEIRQRAIGDTRLQKQLISFEFYLKLIFLRISNKYGRSLNNYRMLVNLAHNFITHNKNEEVFFTTFNYDLLLDKCLKQEIEASEEAKLNGRLFSYIKGRINLIKLHGSCDWNYYIVDSRDESFADLKEVHRYCMKYPSVVNDLKNRVITQGQMDEYTPIYRTGGHSVTAMDGSKSLYLYPAIAIPLPKKHAFVCPNSHIVKLENALQQTDRILIIGWRGGDENFIKLMEKNIKQSVSLTIVSNSDKGINEARKNLIDIENISSYKHNKNGFTQFMRSGKCEEFFS